MNLFQPTLHPTITDTELSLRSFISQLIISNSALAVSNNTSIINNVEHRILIKQNNDSIVRIIDELLTTVLSNARNSRIYISAEKFKDVVILNIQDRNNNNGYAMAFSVMTVEREVIASGGSLTIEGKQSKIATVSFCFPNANTIYAV